MQRSDKRFIPFWVRRLEDPGSERWGVWRLSLLCGSRSGWKVWVESWARVLVSRQCERHVWVEIGAVAPRQHLRPRYSWSNITQMSGLWLEIRPFSFYAPYCPTHGSQQASFSSEWGCTEHSNLLLFCLTHIRACHFLHRISINLNAPPQKTVELWLLFVQHCPSGRLWSLLCSLPVCHKLRLP